MQGNLPHINHRWKCLVNMVRGERVPSQKQLKWSQLKVGITRAGCSYHTGRAHLSDERYGGVFTKKIRA